MAKQRSLASTVERQRRGVPFGIDKIVATAVNAFVALASHSDFPLAP